MDTRAIGGPRKSPSRRTRMDSQQFDTLVKTLSAGTPRRRVLKGLVAAAFGGAIAATGAMSTSAAPPNSCLNSGDCPDTGCIVGTCVRKNPNQHFGRCQTTTITCQGQGQICCTRSGAHFGECVGHGACK